jgi:hypothetical protein
MHQFKVKGEFSVVANTEEEAKGVISNIFSRQFRQFQDSPGIMSVDKCDCQCVEEDKELKKEQEIQKKEEAKNQPQAQKQENKK